MDGINIIKSPSSNARDTIRDGNGGKGGALSESKMSNVRYGVRNYQVLDFLVINIEIMRKPYRIGVSITKLNIAPICYITGIIGFSKGGATRESSISNARDTIRDGDGAKAGAFQESRTSNARNAARDSDGSEGSHIIT